MEVLNMMIHESEFGLAWFVYWSAFGVAYPEAAFHDRLDAEDYAAKLAASMGKKGDIKTGIIITLVEA